MKNRNREDFAKFMTSDLATYNNEAGVNYDAYSVLEHSRPKRLVNRTCKDVSAAIRKIISSRNLDEMIALEQMLQTDDLEKYAHSPSDKKNVEQGLADLQSGMHSYAMLKSTPRQYEEFAKTFTDSNRDKRLGVPKDGMRYTLASQMTRLHNRRSLQMSEEERELLGERSSLVDAIREEYSALQVRILHGDED